MLKLAASLCRERLDAGLASAALVLMLLIPLLEIILRPLLGQGVENAPVLVQHLGLLLAMFGALVAERGGHLTSLGGGWSPKGGLGKAGRLFQRASASGVCALLAYASWSFVRSEMDAPQALAYGISGWWFQLAMPLGFTWLAIRQAWRMGEWGHWRILPAVLLPMLAWWLGKQCDGASLLLWPLAIWLVFMLLLGAPIFAVLGGLALALFGSEGQPLASVPLSHYQITVNPSLPALPLFTLAGLVFARTQAAVRLGGVFSALFGQGARGTAIAAAALCSCFTALTGGSGVTILALGGLLLPLLTRAGYPESRGVGLVTSASALGVLLAPSVPLIMYAIIARVPINAMFLAGLLPALVMVACLLLIGGFLRRDPPLPAPAASQPEKLPLWAAIRGAIWEMMAPVVAIGSLISGLATPTESAALTAAYALLTQTVIHRELDWRALGRLLSDCAQVIGGIMLILGMALALTNYLIDAGVPDQAVEWAQAMLPNRWIFLLALNVFLLLAGALMEIFAAIIVLTPLLLPVAQSYGIDPIHFGVIFLANLEMGFLCPPAGMNLYFASAMFGLPIRQVAAAVLPAILAMFVGALLISLVPWLATGLPYKLLQF